MKVKKLNESMDSPEYKIQRYEEDIPELFATLHDNYMTGNLNAKAYAEVLQKVYDALTVDVSELGLNEDTMDSTTKRNLKTTPEEYLNDYRVGNGGIVTLDKIKDDIDQAPYSFTLNDVLSVAKKCGYSLNRKYGEEVLVHWSYKEDVDEFLNESAPIMYEVYNGYYLIPNAAGDGIDICSRNDNKIVIEDEGYASMKAAKDAIDRWYDEAEAQDGIQEAMSSEEVNTYKNFVKKIKDSQTIDELQQIDKEISQNKVLGERDKETLGYTWLSKIRDLKNGVQESLTKDSNRTTFRCSVYNKAKKFHDTYIVTASDEEEARENCRERLDGETDDPENYEILDVVNESLNEASSIKRKFSIGDKVYWFDAGVNFDSVGVITNVKEVYGYDLYDVKWDDGEESIGVSSSNLVLISRGEEYQDEIDSYKDFDESLNEEETENIESKYDVKERVPGIVGGHIDYPANYWGNNETLWIIKNLKTNRIKVELNEYNRGRRVPITKGASSSLEKSFEKTKDERFLSDDAKELFNYIKNYSADESLNEETINDIIQANKDAVNDVLNDFSNYDSRYHEEYFDEIDSKLRDKWGIENLDVRGYLTQFILNEIESKYGNKFKHEEANDWYDDDYDGFDENLEESAEVRLINSLFNPNNKIV